MKKFTRRVLSLALALCLVASMAVMASAATYNDSGSYGSSIWGADGSCSNHRVTATTGLSNTTYLVYSKVEYYYNYSNKPRLGGSHVSDPLERSSTAALTVNDRVIVYLNAWHYVNSTIVYTVSNFYA